MTEEDEIQIELVAQLRLERVRFFHPVNEGKIPKHYRARLKRKGLSTGISDLIIITPPPIDYRYRGAALELKSSTGTPTPEQREWLRYFASIGWLAACEKGFDNARARLVQWGYLPMVPRLPGQS